MITKNIYMDAWNPAETSVTVQQGEVNARFLHVHLMNNGVPLNLAGCEAAVYCTKPDGTTIFNTCDITDADKGQVTIPLTQQMGLVPGILRDMELRITDADSMLKVRGLQVRVRASGDYDSSIESKDEFTALQAALNASGCYLPEVRQPADSVMEVAFTPSRPEMAEVPVQQVMLPAGPVGPVGPQGPKGDAYTLTEADKADIAERVDGAVLVQAPQYVDSVAKMTDTGKVYVLASTGELWAYMDTTTTGTVREDIDAGVIANSRLGSDGSIATDSAYAGYVATSNYIDLTAYPIPFTLHLEGADFLPEGNISYTRMATYDASKTKIACGAHYQVYGAQNGAHAYLNITKDDIVVDDNGDAHFTFNQAVKTNTDAAMQYVRLSGAGTDTKAVKVYATYTGTITGGQWVSTGTSYAPALSADDKAAIAGDVAAMIDTQLLSVIGEGTVTV